MRPKRLAARVVGEPRYGFVGHECDVEPIGEAEGLSTPKLRGRARAVLRIAARVPSPGYRRREPRQQQEEDCVP